MRAGCGGLESEVGATSCGSTISLLRSISVIRLGFAGTGRAGEMTGMRAAGTASKGTRAGIFSIGGGGISYLTVGACFCTGGDAADAGTWGVGTGVFSGGWAGGRTLDGEIRTT